MYSITSQTLNTTNNFRFATDDSRCKFGSAPCYNNTSTSFMSLVLHTAASGRCPGDPALGFTSFISSIWFHVLKLLAVCFIVCLVEMFLSRWRHHRHQYQQRRKQDAACVTIYWFKVSEQLLNRTSAHIRLFSAIH